MFTNYLTFAYDKRFKNKEKNYNCK